MSFSVSHQLEVLLKGVPSPELSFNALVHQLAVQTVTARFGQEVPFIVDDEGVVSLPFETPNFTSGQIALAKSYQDKMKSVSLQIINGSNAFINQMAKVNLSFMGQDENIGFTDLETADSEQWETYINTHLVATLELLAITTQSEISTYKALIQSLA